MHYWILPGRLALGSGRDESGRNALVIVKTLLLVPGLTPAHRREFVRLAHWKVTTGSSNQIEGTVRKATARGELDDYPRRTFHFSPVGSSTANLTAEMLARSKEMRSRENRKRAPTDTPTDQIPSSPAHKSAPRARADMAYNPSRLIPARVRPVRNSGESRRPSLPGRNPDLPSNPDQAAGTLSRSPIYKDTNRSPDPDGRLHSP